MMSVAGQHSTVRGGAWQELLLRTEHTAGQHYWAHYCWAQYCWTHCLTTVLLSTLGSKPWSLCNNAQFYTLLTNSDSVGHEHLWLCCTVAPLAHIVDATNIVHWHLYWHHPGTIALWWLYCRHYCCCHYFPLQTGKHHNFQRSTNFQRQCSQQWDQCMMICFLQ